MNTKKRLHIVKASRMAKIDLVYLIFGKTVTEKYINLTISEDFWGEYHPPTHVQDIRRKKPINIMQKGIDKGVIYTTV